MWRPMRLLIICGSLSLASTVARAQDASSYPPAAGHMTVIPPVFPAPGGVGGDYVETFPTLVQPEQALPQATQPVTPAQVRPVAPAQVVVTPRPRLRLRRGARVYSRGYSQAPVQQAAPLPQGQLYWPGSYLAPGYTPFSRFQTYGQGYQQSPYGSNFWGGYYKGYSLSN